MKELSRASSSRSLRIESYASYNYAFNLDSAYNLASYSCKLDEFAKLDSSSSILENPKNIEDSLAASYNQHDKNLESSSHHIKFNNSKLGIEMTQIENQLNFFSNLSNFVPKIPIFEEESESTLPAHFDNPSLNINIIRKRNIKRKTHPFVPDVE